MNDGDGFRYGLSKTFGGTKVVKQNSPTLMSSNNFYVGVCLNEQNKEDR